MGEALGRISQNPSIAQALFEVLETQNALQSPLLEVDILPAGIPVWYGLSGSNHPPPPKPRSTREK